MISAIAPFFVRFNDYRSAPNADTVLIAQPIVSKFPEGASLELSRRCAVMYRVQGLARLMGKAFARLAEGMFFRGGLLCPSGYYQP